MSEKELYDALENARKDLEKYVVRPTSITYSCLRHVIEVLKDKKVQEHFICHLKDEYFQGFSCHSFVIEEVKVVFTFVCKPPRICFVAPAFAVNYDLGTQTVTGITDPYIGF
jgi:hypothetical protein